MIPRKFTRTKYKTAKIIAFLKRYAGPYKKKYDCFLKKQFILDTFVTYGIGKSNIIELYGKFSNRKNNNKICRLITTTKGLEKQVSDSTLFKNHEGVKYPIGKYFTLWFKPVFSKSINSITITPRIFPNHCDHHGGEGRDFEEVYYTHYSKQGYFISNPYTTDFYKE